MAALDLGPKASPLEIRERYRDLARKHLKRGKVDCSLRLDRQNTDTAVELNRPLLLQILGVLEQIKRDAPEAGAPSTMGS